MYSDTSQLDFELSIDNIHVFDKYSWFKWVWKQAKRVIHLQQQYNLSLTDCQVQYTCEFSFPLLLLSYTSTEVEV